MLPKSSPFAQHLVRGISEYSHVYGKYAGPVFWMKAVLLFVFWLYAYIHVLFLFPGSGVGNLFMAVLWGIASLLLIFNVGHDAVHGVVSRNKMINSTLQHVFSLVGGNAYSWRLKHNLAHHRYTNIEGKDFDTELSPLMRLSTKAPMLPHYRWQHIYFVLIYPLLSLLIIWVGDFKIFSQTIKSGIVRKHPAKEYAILITGKLFYLVIFFVFPHYLAGYSWMDLVTAFLLIHCILGILIAIVFMPSHYFTGSSYFDNKQEADNWFVHQISTTQDLSPDNKVIGHLIGGLNLNVAHHVFPAFCHTHYFALTRMLASNANLYGVKLHQRGILKAFYDHIMHLKKLGRHD